MTLNLQEILRTLRLWMMGNSSSLHLAIIYMDLSLFVCQLFGHAVSSSLWHKYSAEVKKKKKKIPSFCSLVMLRLFLESKQMYPSLWYRHVVWSSGENRRREGCSYVEKPFHMEDTTVWSCEHTNKWTRCVVLRTMETFLLRLDFPCRFWTLIMWEWQELEKSMKMHHYNSAGMHFHSKPFSLESVSRKLWSEVSSFVSPLVKYFMPELSLIHVLNTAEQSLKIAQRAPGASVPLNTFVPSLWEIHHIFSVNSGQEQLWS